MQSKSYMKNLKEIHRLTTVHGIRHICCNRIYYYTGWWVEKEYKGSWKNSEGSSWQVNALSQKEIIRREAVSGNRKDSNFLNKATRSRDKCKLQMKTLNKIQNSKHSQLEREELQFDYWPNSNSKLILQRLKRWYWETISLIKSHWNHRAWLTGISRVHKAKKCLPRNYK